MRDRKDWMNKAVDPILELLDERLVLNAQAIYFSLQFRSEEAQDAPGRTTIYRALEKLLDNGYIKQYRGNESYYTITDKGKAYLEDEPDSDSA